jgi:hypothetical protein
VKIDLRNYIGDGFIDRVIYFVEQEFLDAIPNDGIVHFQNMNDHTR